LEEKRLDQQRIKDADLNVFFILPIILLSKVKKCVYFPIGIYRHSLPYISQPRHARYDCRVYTRRMPLYNSSQLLYSFTFIAEGHGATESVEVFTLPSISSSNQLMQEPYNHSKIQTLTGVTGQSFVAICTAACEAVHSILTRSSI
jgi:hypothetical protein